MYEPISICERQVGIPGAHSRHQARAETALSFIVGAQLALSIPPNGYSQAIAIVTPGTESLLRMRLADNIKGVSVNILTLQIFGTTALLVSHLFVVVRNRLVRR
jgi:hypothetical protein